MISTWSRNPVHQLERFSSHVVYTFSDRIFLTFYFPQALEAQITELRNSLKSYEVQSNAYVLSGWLLNYGRYGEVGIRNFSAKPLQMFFSSKCYCASKRHRQGKETFLLQAWRKGRRRGSQGVVRGDKIEIETFAVKEVSCTGKEICARWLKGATFPRTPCIFFAIWSQCYVSRNHLIFISPQCLGMLTVHLLICSAVTC